MRDPSEIFAGPAITALGLAASRTVESARPDRLIDDPLARVFVQAADVDLPMRLDWPQAGETVSDTERLHLHGSRYIGLRTRAFDDLLGDAARDGIRQGVVIGAGLDTRAFRLGLPDDFQLIELDQRALLEWKQIVLEAQAATPSCRRSWIGHDLREEFGAALAEHGFDATQPTAFVAEGLVPYLTPRGQRRLLDQLHALAAPASVVAFDHLVGDPHAAGRVAHLSRRSGLDMRRLLAAGEHSDVAETLRDRGWNVREIAVADLAAAYHRDLTDPFQPTTEAHAPEPPWLDTRFVNARR